MGTFIEIGHDRLETLRNRGRRKNGHRWKGHHEREDGSRNKLSFILRLPVV